MAKALVNGIQVHYQRKGTGPDVILIHGITSCLAQWYVKVFPELARNYCVTIYDLRGHGLSDITTHGYTSVAMAEDQLALMDHLDIESARLVGHSFGGAIALHAAAVQPQRVKGVTLLDTGIACLRHLRLVEDWPGWKLWGDQLRRFGITLDRFVELDKKLDVTEIIRQGLSVPLQGGFRKGQSAMTPRLKRLLEESKVGSEFREVAGLTEAILARITTPVLAVYGDLSPYLKMAAHLSRIMPKCRYEVLEGAGHFYAAEDPGRMIERMSGFLQDPQAFVAGRTTKGRSQVVNNAN